jgi:hypothetical protein
VNRYARDMMSRRGRDGRNPYGSAGGYISRTRPSGRDRASEDIRVRSRGGRSGRDYNYGMDANYDYNSEYSGRQDYRDYAEHDMGKYSMDYEQSRQSGRDYNYEQDGHYGRTYYPIEAMGTFNGYYGMGEEDYGYYGRDYAGAKLSTKELKKWEKELENADGSKGKKWEVDQIKQVAQQHNIRFDEYRPETLTAVANMLYSDYCKVLGSDMMLYVKLAKAFLDDDDFEGDPEEKVMLYYKCIVSKDED